METITAYIRLEDPYIGRDGQDYEYVPLKINCTCVSNGRIYILKSPEWPEVVVIATNLKRGLQAVEDKTMAVARKVFPFEVTGVRLAGRVPV